MTASAALRHRHAAELRTVTGRRGWTALGEAVYCSVT